MDSVILQEVSRLSIEVDKKVETSLSWRHRPLICLTDKGLNIFNYNFNLQSYAKEIEFFESHIPCSNTFPIKSIPKVKHNSSFSNICYNEILINPTYWRLTDEILSKELATISHYEISKDVYCYNECVIATLSTFGTVIFYRVDKCGWTELTDLSDQICTYYEVPELKGAIPINKITMKALENVFSSVQTVAFCWGSKIGNESCNYFVTAQKNCDILLWSLNFETKNYKCLFKIKVESSLISSVHWIKQSDENFLIIYADIKGELYILKSNKENDMVTLSDCHCLWRHHDRMIVKYLKYFKKNNKIILIYAKFRHLIVQVLDENLDVIYEQHKNINDCKINDISQDNQYFLITTSNFKIFYIDTNTMDYKVKINLKEIKLKDKFSNHQLFSLDISSNSIFWAMIVFNEEIICEKKILPASLVIFVNLNENNELEKLLSQSERYLYELWDYIEIIRFKSVKTKNIPIFDYKQLYDDALNDIFKMKIYLVLVVMVQNLQETIYIPSDLFPEKSIDKIKQHIVMLKSKITADNLYQKFNKENCLSQLELETLCNTLEFIKLYCGKNNLNINKIIDLEKFKAIILPQREEHCDECQEKLEEFLCKKGHFNMLCTLSLKFIKSDNFLCCMKCNSCALIELLPSKPRCVFCDQFMTIS